MATVKSQQGVVLIVALVFLIALTAVVGALMQNTSSDIKMSGAGQAKVVATQEAISALDEVIFNQVTQTGGVNNFASPLGVFPLIPAVTADNTTAQISVANINNLVVDCPHSQSASSAQVLKCNVLRVQINRLYGRSNNSAIQINSGVAQEVLP